MMFDEFGNPVSDWNVGYNGMCGQPQVTVTKKMILDYIMVNVQPSEIVQVDDFETASTRHICPGTRQINILQQIDYPVPTPNGVIHVACFYCPNCRKVWVNKNSLEFV